MTGDAVLRQVMPVPTSADPAPFHDLQRALAAGDRNAINRILSGWIARDADVGDRWPLFADILVRHGEWGLACQAMALHQAAYPDDSERWFLLAVMLARAGRHGEAITIASALTTRYPGDMRFAHFAGALAFQTGAFDEAERLFLSVVNRNPQAAQSWLELCAVHRFTDEDALLPRLEAAAAQARAPHQRAPLLYALGKALDDRGEIDRAFACFAEGAHLVAPTRRYEARADRAQAEQVMREWATAPLPPPADPGASSVMFVTGLPRSGTTLVEQILASHPAVAGGGEVNILPVVVRERGGLSQASAAGGDPALAALYHRLLHDRLGAGARHVDKTPDIGRMLGVVASVMPAAPIVWVRRDPLDTAWSCFRTFFAQGVPWSWSLSDIANHFAIEDALFAFWSRRLGPRLLCVPYEELACDPAPWIRRIEAHVGLDHHADSLTPHRTRRPIQTASAMQVARPVHRASIGNSAAYRRHLRPFRDRYAVTDGTAS